MKNFYLFALALLASFAFDVNAQISITADDLPTVGTSKSVGYASTGASFDLGDASDTAQSWDFSGLVPESAAVVEYVDPAGSVAENDFPTAEMVRVAPIEQILGLDLGLLLNDLGIPIADIPEATAYYESDSDGVIYTSGFNVEINIAGLLELGPTSFLADPNDIFVSPLSFGDELSGAGQFSYELDIPILQTVIQIDIDRNLNADAFGTMELPEGSYDVLRVHEELDIMVAAEGLVDTTIVTEFYKFFTNGENYPVAIFRADAGSVADGPGPIANVEFLSTEIPQVLPTAAFEWEEDCATQTITFTNTSENGDTYEWNFGDETTDNTENPAAHGYATDGDYTVTLTVTSETGQTDTYEAVCTVSCSTDLEDLSQFQNTAYPNPATDQMTITFDQALTQNAKLSILSLAGQTLQEQNIQEGSQLVEVNLTELSNGAYFYQITNAEGATYTNKLVVSK